MTTTQSELNSELDCVFRTEVIGTGNQQTAQCLLLAQLLLNWLMAPRSRSMVKLYL